MDAEWNKHPLFDDCPFEVAESVIDDGLVNGFEFIVSNHEILFREKESCNGVH